MRLISFSLTRDQFEKRIKTHTRRIGWQFAVPGMILRCVDRIMGFKKGERPEFLGFVKIVKVWRERLDAITPEDVKREGFPDWTPKQFVQFVCREVNAKPWTIVTVIEFSYLQTVRLQLSEIKAGDRWDTEPGDPIADIQAFVDQARKGL